MSTLYVVRHGQATFFEDDYDQLSSKGEEQSRLLGDFWIEEKIALSEVYTGSLVRQRRTAEIVGECYGRAGLPWPQPQVLEGLNEYEAGSFLEILRGELSEKHEHVRRLSEEDDHAAGERERYRTFHRLLEAVVRYWIAGDYESDGCEADGFESWVEFRDRVRGALDQILSVEGRGRRVAAFTSGGPIGVAVQTALEAPEQKAGELHWRIHNGSVTVFAFTAGRFTLDQFNSIAHLPSAEMRTYR